MDDPKNKSADGAPEEVEQGLAFAYGEGSESEPAPSVLNRVQDITGHKPVVSLRDAEPAGQAPMLKPLGPDDGRSAGRYMVHGLLGQGGVGSVHRGHDQDLGRDVALKFLHEKHAADPGVLHRFVEEAQIGGQLQHPGIVPVYELGMADDRPFFAMKMVKGQTLAKKLADRGSPADDRRTFLSIFEYVCQTIAYAHARGVVHRDLKPANVMIGSFGEVQVVDWGMGKVLLQGGVADEELAAERSRLIETVRSSDQGTQSVVGSVMGTPAYMPPEQARGDVDAMDERGDVFALGAILCEILTGQPPYAGERNELISMAAAGKLDDALGRLQRSGAEEDLIELAKQCLMPAAAARPQSAEAVARAVHDHLAAAEQRAHDATVRTLAMKRTQKLGIALTVVFAAGLAASLWFWNSASESATSEKAARELADIRAGEASAARDAARANLTNFNRLSHVVRLESAKSKERDLYPAWPSKSAAIRSWLDNEAKGLTDALPELRSTLATLEERALPQTDEEKSAARQAAALESEASERTAWRFEDDADGFLHSTLRKLVADIETFHQREIPAVRTRLVWSEQVEDLTQTRYREKWNEARLAISTADDVTASDLYREVPIDLAPQMGLVPLGMNPVTKLWEFYHLRSAWDGTSDPSSLEIPPHREDGSIEITGDTGIVFVLLPGGTFWMGAQKTDPNGPNYDGQAGSEETLRKVEVAPFFLARHELTQGQWARLWHGDEAQRKPSHYRPDWTAVRITEAHPVEQVSWTMSDELLGAHRLTLPTEPQWEYGCRGTTSTPYWFEFADMKENANVADATANRAGIPWTCETWSDGHIVHAPVGTFGANRFGLHDVHGNVWEWCIPHDRASYGDSRVDRGGGFNAPASDARSSVRNFIVPSVRLPFLGLRPARVVEE